MLLSTLGAFLDSGQLKTYLCNLGRPRLTVPFTLLERGYRDRTHFNLAMLSPMKAHTQTDTRGRVLALSRNRTWQWVENGVCFGNTLTSAKPF